MGSISRRSIFRYAILVILFASMVVTVVGGNREFKAYDIHATHKVNQKLDMKKEKKEIWSRLRGMGYSEAATAGIMGNWMRESSCNRTVTQGHVSWSSFVRGKTGLGLAQWTSSGRQGNLFRMADKLGKQWMDMEVQLQLFEKEMKGYSFKSVGGLDGFKKLTDVDKATVVFENVYERAGVKAMDQRKSFAKSLYKTYTGTEPSSSASSSTSSEGETNSVVDEWGLEGMPTKSGFMNDAVDIKLPSYDELGVAEKYSVAKINEDMDLRNQFSLYDFIRIFVVFLGLCTILYAVFFLVAYIFDRTNNIFDISLLGVMTLGKLRYTDDEEYANRKGYVGSGKAIKISIICMVVGFVVVSGSMYNWISDVLYWLGDLDLFN